MATKKRNFPTKQKSRRRDGTFAEQNNNIDGGITKENFTPGRIACQTINNLLLQADSRMDTDPARAGLHFLIWLSLNALWYGYPWPGEARHG